MPVRQFPPLTAPIETGPVQFGNDWPGLFIRGDEAGAYMAALKAIERKYPLDPSRAEPAEIEARMRIHALARLLRSCLVR